MIPKNINDASKLVDEKLFILYDNFHGNERLVTERELSEAFGKERVSKIISGNDDYWNIVEYN